MTISDTGFDVVRIVTGAGGLGDPHKRDRSAIAEDIGNGFVTPERARDVYRLA